MKKIVLKQTLILALGITSLSAVEINKHKIFTVNSEQESFKTSFKVATKAQNSHQIENRFKDAIELAKKSSICKGGEYRVYPNYKYVKSQRIDDGYRGEVLFQCAFENKNGYEKLINDIKKIKDIELTQNQIQIVAKDKTSDLEKLSYEYSLDYIVELDQYFSKCTVDEITFLNYNQSIPTTYLRKTMAAESDMNTSVTAPIENLLIQSINVNYRFVCEK
ncbi:MAG: hypothetical protein WA945_09445 [Arcobacteraceae bacterium]